MCWRLSQRHVLRECGVLAFGLFLGLLRHHFLDDLFALTTRSVTDFFFAFLAIIFPSAFGFLRLLLGSFLAYLFAVFLLVLFFAPACLETFFAFLLLALEASADFLAFLTAFATAFTARF
jgi:hypothetical protein